MAQNTENQWVVKRCLTRSVMVKKLEIYVFIEQPAGFRDLRWQAGSRLARDFAI